MSQGESSKSEWPRKRFWDKRRVGLVLALVGVVPTLILGIINVNIYYVHREEGVSSDVAAYEAVIATWKVGKYLFWFLPIGLFIHIAGIMETAKPKDRDW